jgi:hypothetical protein
VGASSGFFFNEQFFSDNSPFFCGYDRWEVRGFHSFGLSQESTKERGSIGQWISPQRRDLHREDGIAAKDRKDRK